MSTRSSSERPPRTRVVRVLLIAILALSSPPLVHAQHSVLVEGGSTSWCPHCATASASMFGIIGSGLYDFHYVALVSDLNPFAGSRMSELGITGIPDYVFDGDYTRWVGSGGLPGAYTSRLVSCAARTVADLDIAVVPSWGGSGVIDLTVTLTNNETSSYTGHVHAYVTEVTSRWDTASGQPFHYAMVGALAIDQTVTVGAGESSDIATTWNGSSYGVGDIDPANAEIIVAVFDATTGYVDESASAAVPDGTPPATPASPTGPAGVYCGDLVGYTAVTTDAEGDAISYRWDWGDGTSSGWIGPFPSGDPVFSYHIYPSPGLYEIRVLARDESELESEWSPPLPVATAYWGDTNGDDTVDIADAITVLDFLFGSGAPPDPLFTGDINEDGTTDIADAIALLSYLF